MKTYPIIAILSVTALLAMFTTLREPEVVVVTEVRVVEVNKLPDEVIDCIQDALDISIYSHQYYLDNPEDSRMSEAHHKYAIAKYKLAQVALEACR